MKKLKLNKLKFKKGDRVFHKELNRTGGCVTSENEGKVKVQWAWPDDNLPVEKVKVKELSRISKVIKKFGL